ncbi:alpha/beta hydrolase [Desulfoprunum benzoelyticum]|uniref:Pimeloyl-ACP methyl ester carboxylesterase n=1 Tax=Desulfoprunum benzoelyticum TaxID=1506996 RepID=A0A840URT2_9BACT|nr:alpha/beta hydrolase [Desulfoprunum benzoelyticum]MBB5347373.1 pimeloyl-ACP methyl ester carboxylesterase [Desulfoprunum benzoelyticum]MBM9530948.1 alpha/beta hydrolase [Desulfoprunum benzoelyticum]
MSAYARAIALILALSLLLAGCSTPIGVRRLDPREAYRSSTASPLGGDGASAATVVILHRFNLTAHYQTDPAAAIRILHARALEDKRRDILFALAELAYIEAERLTRSGAAGERRRAPDCFLLAAVYAYRAILDPGLEPAPNLFDRRLQSAIDLYNLSLWQGLKTGEAGRIELRNETRQLPVGSIAITVNHDHLPWDFSQFTRFEAADGYAIRGLSVRNRSDGLGVPLIAVRRSARENLFGSQALPTTAFLRLEGDILQLGNGTVQATLELHSAYEDNTVAVGGREVPLEKDTSITTAYKLAEEEIWSFGIDAFLGRLHDVPSRLYRFQPYQPDRIPVIFVHGTLSSPVWWAEMINTLSGDPILGRRYQFWYFFYNSSRLITVSALDLRRAIAEETEKLDPDSNSAAMQRMVVIGHSQGGLLAKLTAIDTGDRLVTATIKGKIEELRTNRENKEMIRDNMVITPLPSVKRLIFISTPHRGSYLSRNFARNLVHRVITLPVDLVKGLGGIYSFLSDNVRHHWQGKIPTSVDSMSPDDPLLLAIAETPLAAGVKGHSIIAIDDPGAQPPDGDDGVVTYRSAHLDGMESEFIVRSGHSCQERPETIEEVRRILLHHLDDQ